jgi:flagellum-specific peptidoglycan hydrolase FlgJ
MASNFNKNYPGSSGYDSSRMSRKTSAPKKGFEDELPEFITLGWVLRRLWSGLKLVWMALRYRWRRISGNKKVGGFRISWFKITAVFVAVFLVTQKDVRFSINLSAPFASNRSKEEKVAVKNSGVDKFSLGDVLPFGGSKKESTVKIEDMDEAAVNAYLRRFSKVAVAEMRKFGIPASIKLAQAVLESNAGTSPNAVQHNNHFGTPLADEEYVSAWENWRAHSLLLKRDYADLCESAFGYKQWAKGLAQKGYNPDRKYAEKLVQLVEKYGLDRLDE